MAVEENLKLPEVAAGHAFQNQDGCACERLNLQGLRFSDVGGHLLDSLQKILWTRHCKTLTKVKDFLFPLPLQGYPGVSEKAPWLATILLGLSSMNGAGMTTTSSATEAQKKVAAVAMAFLDRMWGWDERVPDTPFSELLKVRGVDYRGEEIHVAQAFNWRSIAGALPREVGSLELEAFRAGGCKHYVANFEEYFLPQDFETIGRIPRVMVSDSECRCAVGSSPQGFVGHFLKANFFM